MKRPHLEDVLASALIYGAALQTADRAVVASARASFTKTANAWAKNWRCRFCKRQAEPEASLCTRHAGINRAAATKRREANKSRGTPPKR